MKPLCQIIKEELNNSVLSSIPGATSLPLTRADVDWKKRTSIKLPSLPASDVSSVLFSQDEVLNWVKEFVKLYGEKPQVDSKLQVTNPIFIKKQNEYIDAKGKFLENKD